MNERAWLTVTRPYRLISHLGPDASRRKLRLLGVACCYRIRALLTDPRSWHAVEVAEQFADGLADEGQLRAAFHAAEGIRPFGNEGAAGRVSAPPGQFAVDYVLGHAGAAAKNRAERKAQCDLIREVFGNPFRTVAFSPPWRTDTAIALAQQMYEARDFGALPILADALQDAGCENDTILSHCRDANRVHVRGCWVVDLLLGKD